MGDIGKPLREVISEPVAPPVMPEHDLPMEDPAPAEEPVSPQEEPVKV